MQVLVSQGQETVSPEDRKGLHPLVIPLSCGPSAADREDNAAICAEESVTGLMRWPTMGNAQVKSEVPVYIVITLHLQIAKTGFSDLKSQVEFKFTCSHWNF